MLRIPRRYRTLVLVFCLWLAFEPLAITMARAGDAPQMPKPPVREMSMSDDEPEDIPQDYRDAAEVKPKDMMSHVLKAQGILDPDMDQGKIKGEITGRAYLDFMMTVTSAYDLMDDGAADAFTIITILNGMKDFQETYASPFQDAKDMITWTNTGVKAATGVDALGKFGDFAGRSTKRLAAYLGTTQRGRTPKSTLKAFWKRGVLRGAWKASQGANKAVEGLADFLSNLEPPQSSVQQGAVKINQTKKYFSFFSKGTDSGMSKAEFAGHTVGIGLAVFGVIVAAYSIASNPDTHGTKQFSYANVKSFFNGAFAACALIAMFWAVPFGTIASIGGLIWLVVSLLGDAAGKYNAKWKQAYRRSFDFLMTCGTPAEETGFSYFYAHKNEIPKVVRSAAWLVADKEIAKMKAQVTDPKGQEKITSIYDAMVKQGVLATYYNKRSFKLPPLDNTQLQELWSKKADYMSWKPTEAEVKKEAERSTLSKALDYVAVWNYPIWGYEKVREKLADNSMADALKKYPPVYFNPDFLLQKRYQGFLKRNRGTGGSLYDLIGLRIEQTPFNYIWMVGMDTSVWDQNMLLAALEGDVFICGGKEMEYLAQIMKGVVDQLKEAVEANDEKLKQTGEFAANMKKQRLALGKLIAAFEEEKPLYGDSENTIDWMKDNPTNKHRKKYWDVWKPCYEAFGWRITRFKGESTDENAPLLNAKNIFQAYKADIGQRLAGITMSVNKQASIMQQVDIMIRGINERYCLFKQLGEDKKSTLKTFEEDFGKYEGLKKYLRENAFLGIGGWWDRAMNWLSDIDPAYKRMEHNANLYMDQVEKYGEMVEKANSNQRGWIWKSDFPGPDEMIKTLNTELTEMKKITGKVKQVINDSDLLASIEILCEDDDWFNPWSPMYGREERQKKFDPLNDIEVDEAGFDY